MPSSLYIEKSHQEIYAQLTAGNNRVFTTFKSVYLTSALVALKTGLSPKQIGKRHEILKEGLLSSSETMAFKYIALFHSGDPKILGDNQKIISTVDELANAGIDELFRILSQGGDNRLLILQEYCKENFWEDE